MTYIEICGFKTLQVGFLIKWDNAKLKDCKDKNTKLPAITGWNLIRIGMKEVDRVHGFESLNLFQCPFDPLLLSMSVYYYTEYEKENKRKKKYMSV